LLIKPPSQPLVQNRNRLGQRDAAEIRKAALEFFWPYVATMRPLAATDGTFTGTVDDNQVFACIGKEKNMFATGVFIRAVGHVHMVILPSFTSSDALRQYNEFLSNSDENFDVKVLVLTELESVGGLTIQFRFAFIGRKTIQASICEARTNTISSPSKLCMDRLLELAFGCRTGKSP
jgi:hypothetical protein